MYKKLRRFYLFTMIPVLFFSSSVYAEEEEGSYDDSTNTEYTPESEDIPGNDTTSEGSGLGGGSAELSPRTQERIRLQAIERWRKKQAESGR